MDHIATTIYQAIVTHTMWKKRLHEAIKNGKYQDSLLTEQDRFTQWLQENADELSLYEHYPKVVELNNKLHNEAQKIMHLAQNGKEKEAEVAIEYGSDFEHLSQKLVQNIIAWHDIMVGKK